MSNLKNQSRSLAIILCLAASFGPGCQNNVSGPSPIDPSVEAEPQVKEGTSQPTLDAGWDFRGGPYTVNGDKVFTSYQEPNFSDIGEIEVYATGINVPSNGIMVAIQRMDAFGKWTNVAMRRIHNNSNYQTLRYDPWPSDYIRVVVTESFGSRYKIKWAGKYPSIWN